MADMWAYVTAPGSGRLTAARRARPEPGADEVLVRVRAAALNNADGAPATDERVAGYEFAGEVVAAPDGARAGAGPAALAPGTRVMGIAAGAFAEYVVAHHRHVLPVPDTVATSEAAALPTGLTTEYGAMRRAGLDAGAAVLLTAATSGIGLLGLRVARVLGASTVIGSTRAPGRRALLERGGADHVVVTCTEDLAARTRVLTGGRGVDVVLDHVGGDHLDEAVQAARTGGTVVSVGRLAGGRGTIDLFALARREVTFASVSYGLTPPRVIGDLLDGVAADLLPALGAGDLVPLLDGVHPFDRIDEALDRLRGGDTQGKVVLTVG